MNLKHVLSVVLVAALAIASPLERRTGRTTPPSGALVVRQSGTKSGEYSTITAAVSALPSGGGVIFVYAGTYNEQVSVGIAKVSLLGETTDIGNWKNNKVTITNNLNAQDNGGNDACATLRAEKDDFNLYNINVANTYGAGKQATAVAARGTRQGFYGAKLTGYQDTLFADGILQYYSNCWIEGAVDYVYGASSAWFGECTFASVGGGAITANSRETTDDPSYYLFDHCTITSNTSTDLTEKVYLGRPWRQYARVVWQNSVLPSLINPKGYSTLYDGATPIFSEYGNTGTGADTSERVTYTAISAALTKTTVLGSDRSWIDTSY